MSCSVDGVWKRLQEEKLWPLEDITAWQQTCAEANHKFSDGGGLCDWLANERHITPYQADIIAGRLREPLRMGAYEILESIESGRLTGIYRARHEELHFPVCLKIIHADPDGNDPSGSMGRFQREARISVQADHLHVVRTFQIGQIDHLYFIAFENLEGQSLLELIRADSPMVTGTFDHIEKLWDMERGQTRPEEVCRLIREAALGLQHLHEQGIVHRDVTPRNLWITEEGHVKVMDFGLSRDALAFLDSPVSDALAAGFNEFLGSTDYLSPEQALDPASSGPSADIYSLGCTFYHALTGRPPYQASTPSKQMIMHALGRYEPASQLNEAVFEQLDEVVAGMMAPHVEDRYRSAADLAEALAPFVEVDDNRSYQAPLTPELNQFLRWLQEDTTLYSTAKAKPPENWHREIPATDHHEVPSAKFSSGSGAVGNGTSSAADSDGPVPTSLPDEADKPAAAGDEPAT